RAPTTRPPWRTISPEKVASATHRRPLAWISAMIWRTRSSPSPAREPRNSVTVLTSNVSRCRIRGRGGCSREQPGRGDHWLGTAELSQHVAGQVPALLTWAEVDDMRDLAVLAHRLQREAQIERMNQRVEVQPGRRLLVVLEVPTVVARKHGHLEVSTRQA